MKKLRFIFLFATIFVISIAILFQYFYQKVLFPGQPESTLTECFSATGASVVCSEIYFHGKLNSNKYSGMEQLKKLVADFSNELGIVKDKNFSSRVLDNNLIREVEINGVLQGDNHAVEKTVNIRAQFKKDENDENNMEEGFLLVDIFQDLSSDGLGEVRKKTCGIFKKFGISPKVNTCITGSIDGKLSYEGMDNLCRSALNGANARKVEGIRDKSLVSVTAYSPHIEDYIKVEGNMVNLNLAIRYNSLEDRTYIWLATPVITNEY